MLCTRPAEIDHSKEIVVACKGKNCILSNMQNFGLYKKTSFEMFNILGKLKW